jgi:hypothetical protein
MIISLQYFKKKNEVGNLNPIKVKAINTAVLLSLFMNFANNPILPARIYHVR